MAAKIKICGLRRPEDIEMVNEALPDYIGLIFAPSKRQISIEEGRKLTKALDPKIKKVGVFVNQDKEYLKEAYEVCGLDVLQLHGTETAEFCKGFEAAVWKAISIASEQDLEKTKEYDVQAVLLDTYHKGMAGGTGVRFDWNMLKGFRFEKPWILAGGINTECIEEALHLQPYGIDVSSGVETDGYKDREKIKEIVKKVREYHEGNEC